MTMNKRSGILLACYVLAGLDVRYTTITVYTYRIRHACMHKKYNSRRSCNGQEREPPRSGGQWVALIWLVNALVRWSHMQVLI